jgi:hypothetical protein
MSVIYQWWYDTVAILAEYDDSEEGTLPSGTLIREVERDIDRARVLCDLKNPRSIEEAQLPKGRVRRLAPFCRATPIQVELVIDDLTTKTEIAQQVRAGNRGGA